MTLKYSAPDGGEPPADRFYGYYSDSGTTQYGVRFMYCKVDHIIFFNISPHDKTFFFFLYFQNFDEMNWSEVQFWFIFYRNLFL